MKTEFQRTGIKLYLIGCFAIAFAACKDNEVAPVETEEALLTKISTNGSVDYEFFYDADKRLYRLNFYVGETISGYSLYEYNENGIHELRRYLAYDNSLTYRMVFTLDNSGRMIKGDHYYPPNTDKIESFSEFEYNTSGQLISIEFREIGNPVYSLEEFSYDGEGNLITVQKTINPNLFSEHISSRTDYTPGSQPPPDQWKNFIFILYLSGHRAPIREMFNTAIIDKVWNSDQEPISELYTEASGHEYEDNGNLVGQVLTHKYIKPPTNEIVNEMTYEYAP